MMSRSRVLEWCDRALIELDCRCGSTVHGCTRQAFRVIRLSTAAVYARNALLEDRGYDGCEDAGYLRKGWWKKLFSEYKIDDSHNRYLAAELIKELSHTNDYDKDVCDLTAGIFSMLSDVCHGDSEGDCALPDLHYRILSLFEELQAYWSDGEGEFSGFDTISKEGLCSLAKAEIVSVGISDLVYRNFEAGTMHMRRAASHMIFALCKLVGLPYDIYNSDGIRECLALQETELRDELELYPLFHVFDDMSVGDGVDAVTKAINWFYA